MKKINLLFFLLATCYSVNCQNIKFGYTGRFGPALSKEKMTEANYISEIMPDFMRTVTMQRDEYDYMNKLSKMIDYPLQENYITPQDNYIKVMDIVSVEISASSNGKTISARNNGEVLNKEQKNVIASADFGTNIVIKFKFKFKKDQFESTEKGSKIKDAYYTLTIIPDTEAEFPGGLSKMSGYFTEKIISKLSGYTSANNFYNAAVKFTVSEEGKIMNAVISRTSSDPKLDKMLLDATLQMPDWKPAKNSKGKTVKQEIRIPFGGDGGC